MNLANLINLGVDHQDITVNPKVEKKILLETFKRKGSTAISMHLGIFNIPLILAKKFRVPLIIWGENSAAEYGYNEQKDVRIDLNDKWLKNYGVTNSINYRDLISYGFKKKIYFFILHLKIIIKLGKYFWAII